MLSAECLIQHEGAIPSGWRRQIRAAGARIRGYVPENAYIIEVPDEAYAKVEAVEHAYLGAYRAADDAAVEAERAAYKILSFG